MTRKRRNLSIITENSERSHAAFYRIVDALDTLKETGEVTESIFDESLPIGNRTVWIEAEGKIYRLTSYLSQICLVETHFGEGRVLQMTKELKEDLNDVWDYAPRNTYLGEYSYGSNLEKERAHGCGI